VSAVLGRFFITALIEPLGRRGSGTLCLVLSGILMVVQGYYYNAFIGSWSVFYLALIASSFFASANYSVVGQLTGADRINGSGSSMGKSGMDDQSTSSRPQPWRRPI
jgi:hypothetical protein